MRLNFLRSFVNSLIERIVHFSEGSGVELSGRFPQYQIGASTYGGLKVIAWDQKAKLTIGAYCSISSGVTIILGGEHRYDWVTTYPFPAFWDKAKNITGHPRTKGDVTIGNDVWIGYHATILSGVTIGDGAVIGANSLVTTNVEDFTIVGGNPARVIRKRFPEETISALKEIKWWEWSTEKIEQALPYLLSTNISAFIEYSRKQIN